MSSPSDKTQGPTVSDVQQKTKRTTLWRVLFAASISLNLLVVGVVLGAHFGGGPQKHGAKRAAQDVTRIFGVGALASAFERRDRREISKLLQNEFGKDGDARKRLATDFAQMLILLRADDFDYEAFNKLIEAQVQHAERRSDGVRRVFLQKISKMSQQERQAFADRFEKVTKHSERRLKKY